MQDVARTALMVAAFRAKESNRPNRLFDDPLSSVQPGDEEANFGRWPRPSAQLHSPGLATSFFVTATRLEG
jgi:O-methyltransferase involved in polyketide biosynthesis